jgi:ADP-ribose pyrophosphatase YjhB (NUDIX family)
MQWYWRTFKPKTFGVKVLLIHPDHRDHVLLVRHTYGNQQRWNLPGGGYKPQKETAVDASLREVNEELSVVLEDPRIFGEHYSELQGKRDTITLIVGTVLNTTQVTTSKEVAAFEWVAFSDIPTRDNVATIVRIAVTKFVEQS